MKAVKDDDLDEVEQEEEEKRLLLEIIKIQNEALKRIYKNTIDNNTDN